LQALSQPASLEGRGKTRIWRSSNKGHQRIKRVVRKLRLGAIRKLPPTAGSQQWFEAEPHRSAIFMIFL